MKILITNTVTQNTGDTAILFGILKQLKEAFSTDIKFIVYDQNPPAALQHYPEIDFRQSVYWKHIAEKNKIKESLNRKRFLLAAWFSGIGLKPVAKLLLTSNEFTDFKEYSSADLVVSTGGTYLVENYNLGGRIFDYYLTLLLKRPLFFYTQSLGPFKKSTNIKHFRKIFNAAKLILLRDQESKNNLLDLKITNTTMLVRPDAAFGLANKTALRENLHKSTPTRPLNIAISVRKWIFFKESSNQEGMEKYINSIRAICVYLASQVQARITFISTCQGLPDYWTDDSLVAKEIVEDIPAPIREQININYEFHTPQEFQEKMRFFDLVIATRMHAMIMSLNEGVPVFPIAYEFKTKELAKILGLNDWLQDIETITPEKSVKSITSFIEQLPMIRKELSENILKMSDQAADAGYQVKRYFVQCKSQH